MKKKSERDGYNLGEDEENVYSEEVREDLIESGEISAEEEGFMAGYDKADSDAEKKKEEDEEEKKKEDEETEE